MHQTFEFCRHRIIKYADDTTLLVAQYGSIDIVQEYNNVRSCSTQNKLFINTDKAKEIIFHRPAARNICIPPSLFGIKSVKQTTLLATDVADTLSIVAYIERLLMEVNQRLYFLSLHDIMTKITIALNLTVARNNWPF